MNRNAYTGGLLESELFGTVEKFSEKLEMYLPYKKAKALVKKIQPYNDPSDPDPRFSNDLHATVAEKLELEDYQKLKFFTAVKSHLDINHKIDAFFEFDSEKGRVVVALDVTSNPAKGEYITDNDIIVFYFPASGLDPKDKEDKPAYNEIIEKISQSVVDMIAVKLEGGKYEY